MQRNCQLTLKEEIMSRVICLDLLLFCECCTNGTVKHEEHKAQIQFDGLKY